MDWCAELCNKIEHSAIALQSFCGHTIILHYRLAAQVASESAYSQNISSDTNKSNRHSMLTL